MLSACERMQNHNYLKQCMYMLLSCMIISSVNVQQKYKASFVIVWVHIHVKNKTANFCKLWRCHSL